MQKSRQFSATVANIQNMPVFRVGYVGVLQIPFPSLPLPPQK